MAEQPIKLEQLIQPLREEIVESQKARIDLLKYKLLVIGGIGTIGLGLSNNVNELPAILALIPICCLYIDILCHHNTLRILVIGQFFKKNGCLYEGFLGDLGGTLNKVGKFITQQKLSGKKPINSDTSKKESSKSNTNCELFSECKHKDKYHGTIMYFAEKNCNNELREDLNGEIQNFDKICPKKIGPIWKYRNASGYFFELEDYALYLSTIFISAVLIIYSFIEMSNFNKDWRNWIILITSLIIIVLSLVITKEYNERKKTLFATIEFVPEKGPHDNAQQNKTLVKKELQPV